MPAMSDNQAVWTVLWTHAASSPNPSAPFEIDDVLPAVAAALKVSEAEAEGKIGMLLTELGRLPEGRRFFAREGNAVVPLPAFLRARGTVARPVDAYPYEL
jgi:hypothetical protein